MEAPIVFGKKLINKFVDDDTATLAASLAFYAALSLAPLIMLFVSVSSQLSQQLQRSLILEARNLMGEDAANAIRLILQSAGHQAQLDSLIRVSSFVVLLISAGLIFGQLRLILNRIFNVVVTDRGAKGGVLKTILAFCKTRLIDIGWALVFVVALTLSLFTSRSISLPNDHTLASTLLRVLVSSGVYFVTFTLLFRYLPTCRIPWTQVAQGGALTALLFLVGKELIGFVLGKSAIGSPYGAAGSVIVLLVWVYYSALITFLGAEVSFLLHPRVRRPQP